MKKTLVYLKEDKLAPKGGPLAIGYYYQQEQIMRGDHYFQFMPINVSNKDLLKNSIKNLLAKLPKKISHWQQERNLIRSLHHTLDGPGYPIHNKFDNYDIIHFHQTIDMYLERENLKNYKGVVVLQSHSPIPLGQEMYSDLSQNVKNSIPHIIDKFEKMDKYAFERADYIVFPCIEACEPYFQTWPYFKIIFNNKKLHFRYILTGITPCHFKRNRIQVLDELSIPYNSFVISYIGRHNTVKGFDLLKEIAKQFFDKNNNSYIVSAGKEEPFKRLEHPQWKEIGFTNDAHSLINASDVFLLPNRMTYFDIVMLEILSLGKIVIASRTGGNKFFENNHVPGVLLYDDIDSAVTLLEKVKSMSQQERKELGERNKNFFKQHLTVSNMYEQYISFLNTI